MDWENHEPSYVAVNVFSENGTNIKNCNVLADYAQQNNLFTTKGWKQFKKYYAEKTTKGKTPLALTTNQINFFEQALHAHQANKAINPDTGKLAEYPALLKSTDGKHWEESTCQEIGRLAQGYPPSIPKGTDTIFFIPFDQIPTG